MAWDVVKEYVHMALGMHRIFLRESKSGAEHHLSIMLKHDSCPLCGHVQPKNLDGTVNVGQLKKQEIALLTESHASMQKHAEANRVPVVNAK